MCYNKDIIYNYISGIQISLKQAKYYPIDRRNMPTYNNKTYIKVMRSLPSFIKRDIYDIPFIESDEIDISDLCNKKWLINLKNTTIKDKNANKKIVHCFCYDEILCRFFNDPSNFLHRVSKYYAIASFDFTMDDKMDFTQILSATYNNRWIGAFLQANGKKVIPTVGWVDEKYDDICFSGLRDGSTFIISTLGANNNKSKQAFLRGYFEMRKRFPHSKIICVGDKIAGMNSDILYITYKESFGNWEKYPGYWQLRLMNPDGSIYYGDDN